MSDAERTEKRAVMTWRVLIALYDAFPHRKVINAAVALGPSDQSRIDRSAVGKEYFLELSPAGLEATELNKRMIEEGVIVGFVNSVGGLDATIPPTSRHAFGQPDPATGKPLSEAVREGLKMLDAGQSETQANFTHWARLLGFEP